MNTSDAASAINTQPRILRQFLRSPVSSFRSVGSGARYDFTADEIPTLKVEFDKWSKDGKPKSERSSTTRRASRKSPEDIQRERDQAVWEEEGNVSLPDMRDPRVRVEVRRQAADAERRLMMMVMAAGMHVTQGGTR